jgi:hypothetical protein
MAEEGSDEVVVGEDDVLLIFVSLDPSGAASAPTHPIVRTVRAINGGGGLLLWRRSLRGAQELED